MSGGVTIDGVILKDSRIYSETEQHIYDRLQKEKYVYLDMLEPKEVGAIGRLKSNGVATIMKHRTTKRKYLALAGLKPIDAKEVTEDAKT